MSKTYIPNENFASERVGPEGSLYHWAWTAKVALELLNPKSELYAIAVEGLSTSETNQNIKVKEEIADLTLYYGESDEFHKSKQCKVIQFKYSLGSGKKEFTASDLSKTLSKFAVQYSTHIKEHKNETADRKLSFAFTTNRVASSNLRKAIEYLRNGSVGDAPSSQVGTLIKSINIKDATALQDFVSRLEIEDNTGNLSEIKSQYESKVIDWSPNEDVSSNLRALEELVKSKATSTGSKNNTIKRANLLNALDVKEPKELLPCPYFFEEVPQVLKRSERLEAIDLLDKSDEPLIIHADGGVGKTIFLRDLYEELSLHGPVVFLDCFAGGNYRIVGERRHAPSRIGMHLVNTLAFQGLCEPILPTRARADSEDYIRKVRRRLEYVSKLLIERRPESKLYIFIDAADNAATQAALKQEDSFPSMLIESLSRLPIPGVKLIASCRSHRRSITYQALDVSELKLRPFDRGMSDKFVLSKINDATDIQRSIAFSRSKGNGRVLTYLCEEWDREVKYHNTTNKATVEDLIETRVKEGEKTLIDKGASKKDVDVLFAALARLPFPLPIEQLSRSIDLTESQVQSYCNDLIPLLEQTPEGVIFRDEPTDTWFREKCSNTSEHLNVLIDRLTGQQIESSYAAIALPEILLEAENLDAALELALSNEFPKEMKTSAAKRYLSEVRIQAALKLSALNDEVGSCVYLLAHLAVLNNTNTKCDSYISDNVHLIGGLKNYEITSRIFDNYSGWRGARSGRLCLYYLFSQSMDEAAAHLKTFRDWVAWYFEQEERCDSGMPKPEDLELAVIPLFFCLTGAYEKAIRCINGALPEHFRYSISQSLAGYLHSYDSIYGTKLLYETLENALNTPATIVESKDVTKELILALSSKLGTFNQKAKQTAARLKSGFSIYKNEADQNCNIQAKNLQNSLLDAAFQSLKYNKSSAKTFLKAANVSPVPDYHYFANQFGADFRSTLYSGVIAAISANQPILRKHFFPINYAKRRGASAVTDQSTAAAFFEEKSRLASPEKKSYETKNGNDNTISSNEASRMSTTVELLFNAAKYIEKFVTNAKSNKHSDIIDVCEIWTTSAPSRNYGHRGGELGYLKKAIYEETICCCFRELAEGEKQAAAESIFAILTENSHANKTYISFIKLFTEYEETHEIAGELSNYFSKKIEELEDVDDRGAYSSLLSRAILPIDINSAEVFFLDGIEKLDGIGTQDQDIIFGILELAASNEGDVVPAETAQRLMNLCENIIEDSDKFPWPLFCSAATHSFPWHALARSQRWEFRDVVDFEYINGIYAKQFVEKGILSPARASILYALDEAVDYPSDIGLSGEDILTAIIEASSGSEKHKVASFLIGITRHDKELKSASGEWKAICKKYGKYLIGKSELLTPDIPAITLTGHSLGDECKTPKLKTKTYASLPSLPSDRESEIRSIAKNLDPLDAGVVDKALSTLKARKYYGRTDEHLIRELRKTVQMADRAGFLEMLLNVTQLDYYARIISFEEACSEWDKSNAFMKKNKKSYVRKILKVCLKDLFEKDRSFGWCLKRLADLSNVASDEIALLALKYSAKQNITFSGEDAFTLAALLMGKANSKNGREAVIEILSSQSLKVDTEKAEGVSNDIAEAPLSESEAISQLIWVRLGHDNKVVKWRAIYALVAIFEFQLTDDIEKLIKLYEENPRTSFHVPEQKYCVWNAREAFMIALRRVALKTPESLCKFENWIKNIAIGNTEHFVINRLAAETIQILESSKNDINSELQAKIKNVGKTTLEYKENNENNDCWEDEIGQQDFHFDYEFEKYSLSRFGSLFGYDKSKTKKTVVDKIKSIDSTIRSMNDTGGRRRYDRWSDSKKTEYYGEQVVRHSMILASSGLLKTQNILRESSEQECPWEKWQERFQTTFSDGYLLADGTDIDIKIPTKNLVEGEGKNQSISLDDEFIKTLIGWKTKSEPACIAGSWSTAEDCHISITSCIVDSYGAIRNCQELVKREWYDIWLPFYELGHDESLYLSNAFEERARIFNPWIVLAERTNGIDDIDSYAYSKAFQRYEPSKELIDKFKLQPSCRFKRFWKNPRHSNILASEAWGTDRHKYVSSEGPSGRRLLLRKKSCEKFLKANKKKIVYTLELKRYGSYKEWENKETLRLGFVVLVDAGSNIRTWKIRNPGQLQ